MNKSKTTTLKLKTQGLYEFTNSQEKDVDAYYKAYLLGDLNDFNPAFDIRDKPAVFDQEGFQEIFQEHCLRNNLTSITFYSKIQSGFIPVGFGLFWTRGHIIQICNLCWFSWASPRQVFLSCYNFYDSIRRKKYDETKFYKVLEFTRKRDQKMFDKLESFGILKKVGVIDELYPDESCILYVTMEAKT
jgi:hypothetical protein